MIFGGDASLPGEKRNISVRPRDELRITLNKMVFSNMQDNGTREKSTASLFYDAEITKSRDLPWPVWQRAADLTGAATPRSW